ncbi:MAG: HIT family protein [Chloroflexi bacterium]|nr:HIT family protein [Chloroflexota bacterium]
MSDATPCPICAFANRTDDPTAGIVFQDEHWLVRSISNTPAVAGWLLLQARRHIADSADLDAAEAASLGPILQRTSSAVREVTGAVRVYLGSLNEGSPHFHVHVLPRLPEMPNGALGWSAFGLSALAQRGEVRADPEDVRRILGEIRDRLQPHAG